MWCAYIIYCSSCALEFSCTTSATFAPSTASATAANRRVCLPFAKSHALVFICIASAIRATATESATVARRRACVPPQSHALEFSCTSGQKHCECSLCKCDRHSLLPDGCCQKVCMCATWFQAIYVGALRGASAAATRRANVPPGRVDRSLGTCAAWSKAIYVGALRGAAAAATRRAKVPPGRVDSSLGAPLSTSLPRSRTSKPSQSRMVSTLRAEIQPDQCPLCFVSHLETSR